MTGIGAARIERTARLITYLAVGLAVAVAVLASAFAAASVLMDPGGWEAAGLIASYLAPMLLFTAVAWRSPSLSVWVMTAALVVLSGAWGWYVLDTGAWRELMDWAGPILGSAMLVLILPLGALGLRRAFAAGLLLAGAAVVSYTAFLVSVKDDVWYGIGATLTTSRTILCLPTLAIGLLFLLAALVGRLGGRVTSRQPPIGRTPAPPHRESRRIRSGNAARQDPARAGGGLPTRGTENRPRPT